MARPWLGKLGLRGFAVSGLGGLGFRVQGFGFRGGFGVSGLGLGLRV